MVEIIKLEVASVDGYDEIHEPEQIEFLFYGSKLDRLWIYHNWSSHHGRKMSYRYSMTQEAGRELRDFLLKCFPIADDGGRQG